MADTASRTLQQPVSKPLQHSEQARKLSEALEEVRMVFVARDQATKVLQPSDRSLDLISSAVTPDFPTVLRRALHTASTMRTDKFNPTRRQPLTQRIAVGGFVVNQTLRLAMRDAAINQPFDQIHFRNVGRFRVDSQRQTFAVDEQHDLRSLAALGVTNLGAPFFAGENVPSAIASSQLIFPRSSSCFKSRDQATAKTPDSVHCLNRRQHVVKEGNNFGKSFHRAPLRSSHRMPSRQARGGMRGRPPKRVGGFQGKRSSIRFHCSSVNCAFGSVLDAIWNRRIDGHHMNVNLITQGLLSP
jgi:hypothetical protein